MNKKEIIKKKILDTQEMVRDFEMYSKQIDDVEVAKAFKDFAEESGYQASKLQDMLKNIDSDK
ncbi:hypothetical protein [Anaerosalibacter massiliensis]|uniref:Uncharacterized protein n=1 Tax=Anaerosalibacter massiliensis TaxID=1347392 RepID=A0A9X2MFH8_9FIRM|nr:hypothetical protein [Anaerosalibacter massiliensis]MCR2043083.1 hypothetical protein [Anaerosalibacter massiliensis]